MSLNSRNILALVFFILIPFAGFSQPGVPKIIQRFQVGYSFLVADAHYKIQYPIENTSPIRIDKYFRDTIIEHSLTNEGGYGITAGTYIPLAEMGTRGTLALAIDFVYNSYKWNYDLLNNNGRLIVDSKPPVTGNTTQIGVPLSLDYKFGGDARLDKSRRICATVGFGGSALQTTTEYGGDGNTTLQVYPHVKGEFGIFAGMCIKFRALYTFGNFQYVNDRGPAADAQTGYFNSTVSLSGKSSLALSIIIMPFSPSWEKVRWW